MRNKNKMLNKEKGKVSRIHGKYAYVIPEKPSECESCHSRHVCSMNSTGEIKMLNDAGAEKGNNILFTINIGELNIKFLKFVVFALIMLLIGLFLGYYTGVYFNIKRELFSMLCGGFSLIIMLFIYKKLTSNKPEILPRVIKIIKED